MNKLIPLVLLCVLLFGCVSGCAFSNPPDNSGKTPEEENTDLKPVIPDNTPEGETVDLELENTSDLVIALCNYLKSSCLWNPWDPIMNSKSFAQKVDDIKEGAQVLHVACNPDDFYFVCGYLNRTEEHIGNVFWYGESYTWVKFENANEIYEKYKDLNFVVAFQINKATFVTDIITEDAVVPNVEHFQMYSPAFYRGENTKSAVIFDERFIYLHSSQGKNVYHSLSAYNNTLVTIPCVYLNEQYYILKQLYGIHLDGTQSGDDSITAFGKYYDDLMSIMDCTSYSVSENYTHIYALIEIDAFSKFIKE